MRMNRVVVARSAVRIDLFGGFQMISFSLASIPLRVLSPTVVVAGVGRGALVAGGESQPSAAATPFSICSTATETAFPEETPYLTENDAAMNKMMSGMVIRPTGDVDRDFVAMMRPHHQGAIDMAQAVLRNGRNEQIRRLAQEVIVTQHQKIAALQLSIADPLPPSVASPTPVSPLP